MRVITRHFVHGEHWCTYQPCIWWKRRQRIYKTVQYTRSYRLRRDTPAARIAELMEEVWANCPEEPTRIEVLFADACRDAFQDLITCKKRRRESKRS